MLFTSYGFLLFLAITLTVCLICPGRHRWKLLLVASLVFYGMSGLRYLAYISTTILTAYVASRMIDRLHRRQDEYLRANAELLDKEAKKRYKAENKTARMKWAAACLILNLGILAVIKYTDFAILNINALSKLFGRDGDIAFFRFALPLGISFYIFQTMGYVIDVYRGKHQAEKNLFKLALFCSFFPQVIQGPISRYSDIGASLFADNKIAAGEVSFGLQRVALGFFKKLVIADRLIIAVKALTLNPDDFAGGGALLATLLYAVTLYADFSGGIDITIGVAEAMGVKIKENFDRPFYAVSIADHWRRWHITMGTWFKDYLFYPVSICKPVSRLSKRARAVLGDNVGKRAPIYLSTLTVWLATGIWHGASWSFVVWGLANGLIFIISDELTPLYKRFHARFAIGRLPVYRAFTIVRTFCMMGIIRMLIAYDSIGTYFATMWSIINKPGFGALSTGGMAQLGLDPADYIIAFTGVVLLIIIGRLQLRADVRELLARRPALVRYSILLAMVFVIVVFGAYGVGYDASQFIYNQF